MTATALSMMQKVVDMTTAAMAATAPAAPAGASAVKVAEYTILGIASGRDHAGRHQSIADQGAAAACTWRTACLCDESSQRAGPDSSVS